MKIVRGSLKNNFKPENSFFENGCIGNSFKCVKIANKYGIINTNKNNELLMTFDKAINTSKTGRYLVYTQDAIYYVKPSYTMDGKEILFISKPFSEVLLETERYLVIKLSDGTSSFIDLDFDKKDFCSWKDVRGEEKASVFNLNDGTSVVIRNDFAISQKYITSKKYVSFQNCFIMKKGENRWVALDVRDMSERFEFEDFEAFKLEDEKHLLIASKDCQQIINLRDFTKSGWYSEIKIVNVFGRSIIVGKEFPNRVYIIDSENLNNTFRV